MSTNQETNLRHEFEAVGAPGSLTFSPVYVLRKGHRTLVRRRVIGAGSAALAVGLIAVGSTLMTRPHNVAVPPPASHTAPTGIVRAEVPIFPLTGQVELNRDVTATSNVKLFVVNEGGRRQALGAWSTAEAGLRPETTWKSGMLDGHPYTIGLVPGVDADVRFAKDASFVVVSDEVKGTGYTIFAIQYKNGPEKEAARPTQIAGISWMGPTGVVEGIEGDQRLTGQVLTIDRSVSVKITLRPVDGGRRTVLAQVRRRTNAGSYAMPLTVITSDPSGVAVVTGRYPIDKKSAEGNSREITDDGSPVAAGILPTGASDVGVILTTNEVARELPTQERLPDGSVIFAIRAQSAHPSSPSKDSIKAVTWTNADGSQGRKEMTQQKRT